MSQKPVEGEEWEECESLVLAFVDPQETIEIVEAFRLRCCLDAICEGEWDCKEFTRPETRELLARVSDELLAEMPGQDRPLLADPAFLAANKPPPDGDGIE
jgi:hypothetical protein